MAVPVLDEQPEKGTAWWIVAVAVLAALAIAGAGVRWLRGTPPRGTPARLEPPPPVGPPPAAAPVAGPDPVEAELQELVAEERARQMSRETAAIRHGPG